MCHACFFFKQDAGFGIRGCLGCNRVLLRSGFRFGVPGSFLWHLRFCSGRGPPPPFLRCLGVRQGHARMPSNRRPRQRQIHRERHRQRDKQRQWRSRRQRQGLRPKPEPKAKGKPKPKGEGKRDAKGRGNANSPRFFLLHNYATFPPNPDFLTRIARRIVQNTRVLLGDFYYYGDLVGDSVKKVAPQNILARFARRIM